MNIDFSFVTGEWIKRMIDELGISQRDLAAAVNTTAPNVNGWISGARNPSGPSQAAIYYFIREKIFL